MSNQQVVVTAHYASTNDQPERLKCITVVLKGNLAIPPVIEVAKRQLVEALPDEFIDHAEVLDTHLQVAMGPQPFGMSGTYRPQFGPIDSTFAPNMRPIHSGDLLAVQNAIIERAEDALDDENFVEPNDVAGFSWKMEQQNHWGEGHTLELSLNVHYKDQD